MNSTPEKSAGLNLLFASIITFNRDRRVEIDYFAGLIFRVTYTGNDVINMRLQTFSGECFSEMISNLQFAIRFVTLNHHQINITPVNVHLATLRQVSVEDIISISAFGVFR